MADYSRWAFRRQEVFKMCQGQNSTHTNNKIGSGLHSGENKIKIVLIDFLLHFIIWFSAEHRKNSSYNLVI